MIKILNHHYLMRSWKIITHYKSMTFKKTTSLLIKINIDMMKKEVGK